MATEATVLSQNGGGEGSACLMQENGMADADEFSSGEMQGQMERIQVQKSLNYIWYGLISCLGIVYWIPANWK